MLVGYENFDIRFDELWFVLSREAVYSGDFDRRFEVVATRRGADQFDDLFLAQVRNWRERLAIDIYANTPGLSAEELTYAVQLFLSRIVFLRICEDREIEKYETLKNLAAGTFDALMNELRRADEFYDSGLFRLLDDSRLRIRISDDTLQSIIDELYYPRSPYTFAVIETEVLGEIYEQFLGDVITVSNGKVRIVSKPEVRESGGVVPTPPFIANAITERTIGPLIKGKSPQELDEFTVADICCGSGTFLLSAYELLLDHHLSWYQANNPAEHVGYRIYEATADQWRLTFEEKRRILLTHLRGVDIDPNAVEVTQFSLVLKLIEDESAAALKDFVSRQRVPALPPFDDTIRCGNSLVSAPEWRIACGALPASLIGKVNPFTWSNEFWDEMARGGFDVIIGNPPYIRIQNMTAYSPQEVAYYRNPASHFTTAQQDNFDKYALFIERALTLVKPKGRIGFIVPHKFMNIQAGRALRRLITDGRFLDEVVHFGVKQVFGPGTTNYTCLLILDRGRSNSVRLERPGLLEAWRYGQPGPVTEIPAAELTEEPWQFADDDTRALFEQVRAVFPKHLGQLAEIFVGVQTSADLIYIFRAAGETAATITLRWNGRDWPIERGILRPCLHDVSLTAFAQPRANAWIIFPYKLVGAGRGKVRAHLIQPEELAAHYPGCWAYLHARRAELEQRNITGGPAVERQWYQYGRSQSLTKFDSPKIILQILSTEPRYTYDDAHIIVTGGGNGPYYMVRPVADAPVSNHYLLAVLNHPLSEAFIRTHTSTFRGGYYSHGKQFIEHLPVPIPDHVERTAIEVWVASLIGALDALALARTPRDRAHKEREAVDLRHQIEQRVSAMFKLSPADMEVVRGVPVPT
jgi:type I restriction-modification system DNA methylase subunit